VKDLLQTHRLVVLSGVSGTGKTRLALETASSLLGEFEHGIWLVELARLSDPAMILPSMAIFGLRDEKDFSCRDPSKLPA
jgi:non-specific serine/threonine protein kinase